MTHYLFVLLKMVLLKCMILILARSAWSRAKKPVIEIGDLSKEESMKSFLFTLLLSLSISMFALGTTNDLI